MVTVNPITSKPYCRAEKQKNNYSFQAHHQTFQLFSWRLPVTFYWVSFIRPISSRHARRGAPVPHSDSRGVPPGEILAPLHLLAQGTWGQTRSGTGDKDRGAGGAAWALHPQPCCSAPCFQEDPSHNEQWPSVKVDKCSVLMTHMH